MPTENRSSNTEQMVSVPREHDLKICRTPLDDLLSGAKTGEIRDCSDREFAAGDTVLLREVDDARAYTGRTTRRTITHVQKYYGLPDHLCVLSYAQHQGEPVALPARKDTTQHWAEPGGVHKAEGWNAYHEELARLGPLYTHPAPFQQGEPVAFYREFVDGREYCEKPFTNDWTPLYTHAEAGEVDRLRNVIEQQRNLIASLRAELAESRSIDASAEPSAAIEIDHDALVAAVCVLRSQGLGNLSAAVEEARTALDRKPS